MESAAARDRAALNTNPNAIESCSPGLRGTSYPGKRFIPDFNRNGGCVSVANSKGATLFRVGDIFDACTQGSSSLATLGFEAEFLRNSIGELWVMTRRERLPVSRGRAPEERRFQI